MNPLCLALIVLFGAFLPTVEADELFWRYSFGTESGYLITGGERRQVTSATPANPSKFRIIDIYVTDSAYPFENRNHWYNQFDTSLVWNGSTVTDLDSENGDRTIIIMIRNHHLYLDPSKGTGTIRPDGSSGLINVLLEAPLSILPAPHQRIDRIDLSMRPWGTPGELIGSRLVEKDAIRQRMTIELEQGRAREVFFEILNTSDLPYPMNVKLVRSHMPCALDFHIREQGVWMPSLNLFVPSFRTQGTLEPGRSVFVKMTIRSKRTKRPFSGRITLTAMARDRLPLKDQVRIDVSSARRPVILQSPR